MPKKIKLNLDRLDVKSFKTTEERKDFKGGSAVTCEASEICNTNNGNCTPNNTWTGCIPTYPCGPMQTIDCADHIK